MFKRLKTVIFSTLFGFLSIECSYANLSFLETLSQEGFFTVSFQSFEMGKKKLAEKSLAKVGIHYTRQRTSTYDFHFIPYSEYTNPNSISLKNVCQRFILKGHLSEDFDCNQMDQILLPHHFLALETASKLSQSGKTWIDVYPTSMHISAFQQFDMNKPVTAFITEPGTDNQGMEVFHEYYGSGFTATEAMDEAITKLKDRNPDLSRRF